MLGCHILKLGVSSPKIRSLLMDFPEPWPYQGKFVEIEHTALPHQTCLGLFRKGVPPHFRKTWQLSGATSFPVNLGTSSPTSLRLWIIGVLLKENPSPDNPDILLSLTTRYTYANRTTVWLFYLNGPVRALGCVSQHTKSQEFPSLWMVPAGS